MTREELMQAIAVLRMAHGLILTDYKTVLVENAALRSHLRDAGLMS